MKTSILCLLAVLMLAAPVLPRAQPMAEMKGMKKAPAANASVVKTGKASGIVKVIDLKAGTVTLQHSPIPGVGWPAMTMTFKASKSAMLKDVKVGQTVDFAVRTPPIGPEVTAIRPH